MSSRLLPLLLLLPSLAMGAETIPYQEADLPPQVKLTLSRLCDLEGPRDYYLMEQFDLPETTTFSNSFTATKNRLVLLPCYIAAYNQGMLGYLVKTMEDGRQDWVLLQAPFPSEGRIRTEPFLHSAQFNVKDGVLSTYYKGRGIGDCGGAAHYSIGTEGLALTKAWHKDCDDFSDDDDFVNEQSLVFPLKP